MLNFDKLNILDKHVEYLKKKLKNQNVFLVGWCIRDLLLWITDEPNDVDVTLAGIPKEIDSKIDKKDISYFMTEKFGTMTIIPKIENWKWETEWLKYEITPFRTEWRYDDFRHPGEIDRVDDLILDSNRREFTISCLYYFKAGKQTPLSASGELFPLVRGNSNCEVIKELKEFTFDVQVGVLEKLWYCVFGGNVMLVQNQDDIVKLFAKWEFKSEYFVLLVKKFNEYCRQNKIDFEFNPDQVKIIIDPHRWFNDLIEGNLKAVWIPDSRFREDALRIIRAVRFVNVINYKIGKLNANPLVRWSGNSPLVRGNLDVTDECKKNERGEKSENKQLSVKSSENLWKSVVWFDFEKNTWSALKKNFYLVQFVAKERVRDELVKVFKNWNPFWFISVLDELNLLKFLFPSLHLTKNIHQPVRYHPFDVYAHTMLCLYELQKINKNYLVRFGMLYHDVWKVDQYYAHSIWMSREEVREILWTWLNHQRGGIDIARKDFQALGFSGKEIEEICRYVEYHHKPGEILDADPKNRIKKVRKLLSEVWYEKFNNLIDVCIADRIWQYNPIQSNNISDVQELRELLEKINSEEWQFTMKDMVINWNDIMSHFKLDAWPVIWDLMWKAFDWVLNNVKERNDKKVILKHLKELI